MYEVDVRHVGQVAAVVAGAMSAALPDLRLPFPVELSVGPSWGQLAKTSLAALQQQQRQQ
jgi:hypothetical protein